MSRVSDKQNLSKFTAAKEALKLIKTNMTIGLGTGSTAKIFVDLLSEKHMKDDLNIKVVATSSSTADQAIDLGLPLTTINKVCKLDIVVDGADEVDRNLNLIKGGGGALLQEKIVAQNSDLMVVIVDEQKIVTDLGKFPLPIEVIRFGCEFTRKLILQKLGDLGYSEISNNWRKKDKGFFLTDEGHYILDLNLIQIIDPIVIDKVVKGITGVVETGLFVNLANRVIIGDSKGNFTVR